MMETNNESDYSCLLYHQRLKYGGRVQRGLKEISLETRGSERVKDNSIILDSSLSSDILMLVK